MKRMFVGVLIVFLLFVFISCGHEHTWKEATCIEPKTCSVCGETEGDAIGHSWKDATCIDPKTCKVCGETEGEVLEHEWADATCTTPKTCINCDKTEGKELGHSWLEATCTEPSICSVCKEKSGEPLGHDAPGLTCTEDAVCLRCNESIPAPGHILTEASCTEAAKCTVCGQISGSPLGHTCSSGKCDRCGIEVYSVVNGRGDDVISNIAVGEGVYRVHFTHSGQHNFIVKAYDANNDRDLLINEIGNYDGYVLLLGSSPYTFEITAGGSWSYTIEPLQFTEDKAFFGRGDYVTGKCSISSGAWEFTHDGKHNFIVKVYTTSGRDLLVNEIGVYSGKKMVNIPTGSYAFFEIMADGNWTIKKAE